MVAYLSMVYLTAPCCVRGAFLHIQILCDVSQCSVKPISLFFLHWEVNIALFFVGTVVLLGD